MSFLTTVDDEDWRGVVVVAPKLSGSSTIRLCDDDDGDLLSKVIQFSRCMRLQADTDLRVAGLVQCALSQDHLDSNSALPSTRWGRWMI